VGFTLAFALQLRKKHGKTSVRVAIHKLWVDKDMGTGKLLPAASCYCGC